MAPMEVTLLSTLQTKTIPRMTLFEAVGSTTLFDLALFGTDNWFIRSLIRLFTSIQNSWDTPFANRDVARTSITEFCQQLSIPQHPWVWDKPMDEYSSLNDFFSRAFSKQHFPPLGSATIVAPTSCTLRYYPNHDDLVQLLIKGCCYQLDEVGIPNCHDYAPHPIWIGYLSPSDYHCVHAPMSGTIIHVALESQQAQSASVKFWSGPFNLLNDNKRLVIVIEKQQQERVALIIVGGVGVNTIVYDKESLWNKHIEKGDWIASFRAGGSAIALFSNQPLTLTPEFELASQGGSASASGASKNSLVQVTVGESLANFSKKSTQAANVGHTIC